MGEPLYLDVVAAIAEAQSEGRLEDRAAPRVIGGRYGLSSKEFTPAMVKAVLDELVQGPAQEPLHGRHHRRCRRHQPAPRRRLRHRARDDHARHVLRSRRRWHRRRQQELDQDHRRRPGLPRPGLLRLRFQEVGLAHGLASALRAGADPLHLPDPARQLHRLPPVPFSRADRRARARGAGGGLSPQQPPWAGRGLAAPAARGPGPDPRPAPSLLCDRRL